MPKPIERERATTLKMAGVTLLLLVPDISVHGGVQSFMRRIWEVMLSLEDEGAKLALASVNDSPASLRGSLRLPRGVPAIAASGSHWVFIARVLMLPRSDIVISGHLGQAIVAWLLKVLGLTRRIVVSL